MDRRPLLFILMVSISFFGIRTWYEKRHEEKIREWERNHSLIESESKKEYNITPDFKEESPALFTIPLVSSLNKKAALLETSSDLLDSVVVDGITETANLHKDAYGIEIGKDLFALLSKEDSLPWPDKIDLQYIKNHTWPSSSSSIKLLRNVTPSYALYEVQEGVQKETVSNTFAIGVPGQDEMLYAIYPIKKELDDPESYQVTPIRIENNLLVDLHGSPFEAQVSLIFSKRSESETIPVGITLQSGEFLTFASNPLITKKSAVAAKKKPLALTPEFYLLENEYQQLVFSTENGALVEINLPFYSNSHTKSIVRPTAVDATIEQTSSKNGLFPLHLPSKEVQQDKGGYYPLLRRSLMSDDAESTTLARVLPKFEALQLLKKKNSSYEVEPIFYTVASHSKTHISFIGKESSGREIRKTYSFPKEAHEYPYCVDLDISIEENPSLSHGEMALTTGVPEIEWMSGTNGASLGICTPKNGNPSLERITLPKEPYFSISQKPNWLLNSNGFFGFIIKPLSSTFKGLFFEKATGLEAPSRLMQLEENKSKTEEELPGYQAALILNSSSNHKVRLYAGPLDETILSTIDEASLKEFGSSFGYQQALTYQGWFTFISEPFARLLYFFMKQFHKVVGSWGLSIIFATIILRILLYPLNSWSMKSMKRMQEVSPLAQALQEKYKKDPTKLQKEMLNLYREKKVNPFSGCLPLLIQMPFLIGMFDLLKSSFSLRGVPFIPGWINDLSAPDVLFRFPIALPIIGQEMHLLPIFLGFIMWFQQSLSSPLPKNQEILTEQQKQQKSMGLIMTVVMTIMFYNFPAGLNIYWASSILLGIAQQWWIGRRAAIPAK